MIKKLDVYLFTAVYPVMSLSVYLLFTCFYELVIFKSWNYFKQVSNEFSVQQHSLDCHFTVDVYVFWLYDLPVLKRWYWKVELDS